MEKLFAYALLMCEGFDVWDPYSEELDRLFLDDPQNDAYLYLETVTDRKKAVFYIISAINDISFDSGVFGPALMNLISDVYKTSNLEDFAKHMYSLWSNLPKEIKYSEPFYTLSYSDDCILYNDEKYCHKLFESAIYYFD